MWGQARDKLISRRMAGDVGDEIEMVTIRLTVSWHRRI